MTNTPTSYAKLIVYFSLILFTGILFPHFTFGQSNKTKQLIDEANDNFKSEDYKEASFNYLELMQKGHTNANIQFKLGTCYLNMPGEETKAIPYLEEATKQISLSYKANNVTERKAPLYALFYLGNAYRINNQLDKALDCYSKFTKSPGYEGKYEQNIVETEIKTCERAKIIQDAPITVKWSNLGSVINTPFSETNPVISGDEKILVFLEELKFYNAVYVSRKNEDTWLPPENINSQIISDGDFYPVSMSFDGNDLYLIKKDKSNSDIYLSHWLGARWSPAKALNGNINSSRQETYASISSDNKTLYFASNRRDSKGGFDIYMSAKESNGDWGKAENLGKNINGKDDEISPTISPDGNTLYFSSKGHYNMGGYDIFYSTRNHDGSWSEAANLGFPINTTNDNIGIQITGNGKTGYISRNVSDGNGKDDIYKVEILSDIKIKSDINKATK